MLIWRWVEADVWSVKLEAGDMIKWCILCVQAHCAETEIRREWQLDIFWCAVFLSKKTNLLKMEMSWGMLISVDACLAFSQSGFYTLAADLGIRIPEFSSIGPSDTCCFLTTKSSILPGQCNSACERIGKLWVPGNSLPKYPPTKEPRQHRCLW